MKQLNLIKRKLKKDKVWNDYKTKFKHKQMRFVVSKIASVFVKNININKFHKIEKSLIETPNGEDMFDEAFRQLSREIKYKADWESLGKFMWYAYQTSTFYTDQKAGIKNIYTLENSIELNDIKREHFLKWLHSVDNTDDKFNNKIMEVQRLVL